MKINDIDLGKLTILCNDLLFKTLVELGQNSKDENWFLVMSNSLANDLKEDFNNSLTFIDVIQAFRQGVRDTNDLRFVLNVQTYYKWLNNHKELIWKNDGNEPDRIDKRLKYRSRVGTGLIDIKKALS